MCRIKKIVYPRLVKMQGTTLLVDQFQPNGGRHMVSTSENLPQF
jgi:hypothetical protein